MCFYILDVIVSASKCVFSHVLITCVSSYWGSPMASSLSIILVRSFHTDSRARQEAREAAVSKLAWYLVSACLWVTAACTCSSSKMFSTKGKGRSSSRGGWDEYEVPFGGKKKGSYFSQNASQWKRCHWLESGHHGYIPSLARKALGVSPPGLLTSDPAEEGHGSTRPW